MFEPTGSRVGVGHHQRLPAEEGFDQHSLLQRAAEGLPGRADDRLLDTRTAAVDEDDLRAVDVGSVDDASGLIDVPQLGLGVAVRGIVAVPGSDRQGLGHASLGSVADDREVDEVHHWLQIVLAAIATDGSFDTSVDSGVVVREHQRSQDVDVLAVAAPEAGHRHELADLERLATALDGAGACRGGGQSAKPCQQHDNKPKPGHCCLPFERGVKVLVIAK